MAKEVTSIRLPADLKRELETRARAAGVSPAALYERLLQEGLRQEAHPLIVFREGASGRRPTLSGTRLSVADVLNTVRAADARGDAAIEEAAEYLEIPAAHVRACLRYYADYQDEVDELQARMDELAERERNVWERERTLLA